MKTIKICLDAGHYGKYNRSPANPAYYESEMNWKLHMLLAEQLERYGFAVTRTRQDQAKDLGLTARGKASKGCDLFVSIHSNAVSGGIHEGTDYPIVYYPVSGAEKELAGKLSDCIARVMGTAQPGRIGRRKGNRGDYYGVIRGATVVGTPGLILEHSFHTNTRATNWLLEEANLAALAQAEAGVLAEHFGLTAAPMGPTARLELPVLKKGARGEPVRALQHLLMGNGFDCGTAGADGSFGGATDASLRAYQTAKGLSVDGSCGPATWGALLGVET